MIIAFTYNMGTSKWHTGYSIDFSHNEWTVNCEQWTVVRQFKQTSHESIKKLVWKSANLLALGTQTHSFFRNIQISVLFDSWIQ